MIEEKLRVLFPVEGDYIEKYPEEWKHEAEDAREFIAGKGKKKAGDIKIIQAAESFYEDVDYDDCPQGLEDECFSVVEIDGVLYKVMLTYQSWGGFHFMEQAYTCKPKTVEVVVYE